MMNRAGTKNRFSRTVLAMLLSIGVLMTLGAGAVFAGTGTDLSEATVSGVSTTYYYTGSSITPVPVVMTALDGGAPVTLTEGIDYTYKYVDSSSAEVASPKYAGTYKVVIEGTGTYTGTKSVSFTIKMKKGWNKVDGEWYYYMTDGTRLTDSWADDSTGRCRLGSDGKIVKDKWVWDKNAGAWFYVGADGYMVSSKWMQYKGDWYYLKSNGYMAASEWANDKAGRCYLGSDGKLVTSGWVKDKSSGEWYYVDDTGHIVKNCWKKDSAGWCYVGSDGKIVKDQWLRSGGAWYYLKPNGHMAANEWAQDGTGNWCYLGSSGKQVKSDWVKTGSDWYYIKSNGYMAKNQWQKDAKGWCYLTGSGKMMKDRWFQYNNEWYYIKADGHMTANGWAEDSNGWCFMDANGKMTKDKAVKTYSSKTKRQEWYYIDKNGYLTSDPYVVVSKSEQKIYYYTKYDNLALETSVVTGKLYPKNHDTPTGTWSIRAKDRNVTLKGLEDDGKTKYESFVRYWMPFIGNSWGLHDADWRGSFGGTIYKYNGSHGCVNMPVSKAGQLYEMIKIGTLVRVQ